MLDTAVISFASGTLDRDRHVCAFFNSPDEEYEILLPFIKEGLDRDERVVQISDPNLRDEKRERLRAFGVDTDARLASGHLELRTWTDAYLMDGHFDQYRMLAQIEETLEFGARMGFPLTRLTGSADWGVEDLPGVTDLLEYEARLNFLLPKFHDPVICIYDARRFGASMAIDILRTHPMVVVGRVLVRNSLFVPPAELLLEFEARKRESVH